ncbi:MAG: PadR family transcriptional regulator [Robiginitomaculum sp.]|nr:PadR family transcriptional regulator [Robiginitomaculum sp.]
MSKPQKITTADLVVLAVLLGHPPLHGYELVKKLEASDVEDWARISIPQVYYSLRKMAKSGHIVPVADTNPSLGPRRTIYKPAKHARKTMQDALEREEWINQRPPTPFITWTALAHLAEISTINEQFKTREGFLNAEIIREQETLKFLKTAKGPGIKIANAMVSLVISQMKAELSCHEDLHTAILFEQKNRH